MTINQKVFFYPPSWDTIIKRYNSDESNFPLLKPMDDPTLINVGEMLEEDVEELDEYGLGTIQGWPAECTEEEEFWQRVNSYPGGTLERTSAYVHNLLNDSKLSELSSTVKIDTKYEKELPLLTQVIKDLRRRDCVTINGKVVYDMNAVDECAAEIFMKEWTDDERAKHTFKKCLKALHKDYHLTTNALKLTTQASLARLSILVSPRFSNFQLKDKKFIHCDVQRVNIDTREEEITRIFYHTYWSITPLESRDPLKHFKASVEFVIGTEDLIAGTAGKAREFERCTKFFDTFDEVEQCGAWPADAETTESYDARVAIFPNYVEHLHPLTAAPALKYLAEKEKYSAADCFDSSIQSRFLPLRKLTFFDQELYNFNSMISKFPKQGEFICNSGYKDILTSKAIKDRLLRLSCLGISELLTKIAYSRFSKHSLDRHVSCYHHELIITQDDESGCYEVTAVSKWYTLDTSQDRSSVLSKFGILLTAAITETELLSKEPKDIDVNLEIRKL